MKEAQAKSEIQLNKIVRLKKRMAENAYQRAETNLRKLDAQIARMRASIDTANNEQGSTSGAELSAAFNYVQKLMTDLKSLNEQRGSLVERVESARQELKRIIVSETVMAQSD